MLSCHVLRLLPMDVVMGGPLLMPEVLDQLVLVGEPLPVVVVM